MVQAFGKKMIEETRAKTKNSMSAAAATPTASKLNPVTEVVVPTPKSNRTFPYNISETNRVTTSAKTATTV